MKPHEETWRVTKVRAVTMGGLREAIGSHLAWVSVTAHVRAR